MQTWMSDILHGITQGLLIPDIVLLVLFIGYALFCIGSIVVEFFTERKHFKVVMPKFLAALMAAEEDGIPVVIEESGLLKRQKIALLTVYDYRILPGDALIALIKRLVNEEESRYDRISGRNNMAARVSPMLGLMGTLIPLGPGIQALGKANTELLSASLLIAFDTTVAGLVVAAVCMIVGKIRSVWYGNYMSALDSAMATMLQKIEEMRAEGKIVTQEPTDYAFLFEQAGAMGAKGAKESGSDAEPAERKNAREGSRRNVSSRYDGVGAMDGAYTARGVRATGSADAGAAARTASDAGATMRTASDAGAIAGVAAGMMGPAGTAGATGGVRATSGASTANDTSATGSVGGVGAVREAGARADSVTDRGYGSSPYGTAAGGASPSFGGLQTSDAFSVGGSAYAGSSYDLLSEIATYPAVEYNAAYSSYGTSADAPASVHYGALGYDAAAPSQADSASGSSSIHPLRAAAAFTPVPDPAFISDLVAASQANPGEPQLDNQVESAPTATSMPTATPASASTATPASASASKAKTAKTTSGSMPTTAASSTAASPATATSTLTTPTTPAKLATATTPSTAAAPAADAAPSTAAVRDYPAAAAQSAAHAKGWYRPQIHTDEDPNS